MSNPVDKIEALLDDLDLDDEMDWLGEPAYFGLRPHQTYAVTLPSDDEITKWAEQE